MSLDWTKEQWREHNRKFFSEDGRTQRAMNANAPTDSDTPELAEAKRLYEEYKAPYLLADMQRQAQALKAAGGPETRWTCERLEAIRERVQQLPVPLVPDPYETIKPDLRRLVFVSFGAGVLFASSVFLLLLGIGVL